MHLADERRHNKSALEVCCHWIVAFSFFVKYCTTVVCPSTTLGRSWETWKSPEIKLQSAQRTINKVRRQLQIFCVDVHLADERRHNKSALEVCCHWIVAFSFFVKYCTTVVYPSTTLGRSWEKMKRKKLRLVDLQRFCVIEIVLNSLISKIFPVCLFDII